MLGLRGRAALTYIGHELQGNVWLRASRCVPILLSIFEYSSSMEMSRNGVIGQRHRTGGEVDGVCRVRVAIR